MTDMKQQVALAAIDYIKDHPIIGIGSGTTVNQFIAVLASMRHHLEGCVAASAATETLLRAHHLPVIALNTLEYLPVYIDGADEITRLGAAIKGGGAALTREKIIARAAQKWVCLIDGSKLVKRLGANHPLPIEVLPMARSFVAREMVKLGGDPVYRENVITDNHHQILDVYHLEINEPIALEQTINQIPGVIENGLFALRPADVILSANSHGVEVILPP